MTRMLHLGKLVAIILNICLCECRSLKAKGMTEGIVGMAVFISHPGQAGFLGRRFSSEPGFCAWPLRGCHSQLPEKKPSVQPCLICVSPEGTGCLEIDVSRCSLGPSPLSQGTKSSYFLIILAAHLVSSFVRKRV